LSIKYNLVGIIGRSCCYLSEHLITISPESQDRPVTFYDSNIFYKLLTITRKYAIIKYKELHSFCLWLLTASWPLVSNHTESL